MRYLAAGLIAGNTMAIVFLGIGAWLLIRHATSFTAGGRRLLTRSWSLGAAVYLSVLPFLAWGAVGLLFGLLYGGFEGALPGRGLASPNLLYTALILLVVLSFLWLLIPLRRDWLAISLLLVSFAAIFGWLLPWLAV